MSASASAPAPVAVAVSASDLAAQDSGRIPPPDRSLERCHELGQASLRCQMNMQIKYNHKTQTPAVLEACRTQIEEYRVCHQRQQEKRRFA